MQVCRTIEAMRAARSQMTSPVSLVPTMGALHAAHASLVKAARAETASVVVSIFVNPLQFERSDDFAKYPRSLETDLRVLEELGVDAVFAPDEKEIYGGGSQTIVEPGPLARFLEGEFRPGHFRGVATVVLKLLNIVAPERAYFGRKDAQQLAVVTRMVADFKLPVVIVPCPTVREPDGLALSSRNALLNPQERVDAVRLSQALGHVVEVLEAGRAGVASALAHAATIVEPLRLEYLAVVDPREFVPLAVAPPQNELLAVGAAYAGSIRLIDNMPLRTP